MERLAIASNVAFRLSRGRKREAKVDIGSKISSGLTQTCAKRCDYCTAKVTVAECGERVGLARVSDPPDAAPMVDRT